jgi:GalNAc-alpha-(1->4)-GalNAc-alpha-(1->3)-diNAcBac-PP-undecaprenol alpha-1,4-N-acetyl-D-galactosaminyltransferase
VVLSFCDRTNVLTLLATRGTAIPVVVSERSDPAAQAMPWPWSWLRTKLYRRAGAVVVLTSAAAATVAPWSAQRPIVIASAVQQPESIARRRPAEGAGGQLIGVGRLEVEKGFDQLLVAFAAIAPQHPQWHLTIHGEGSLRDPLERQRDQLGLSGRVDFPGWTRPIWPALQASDLFVLPSRHEGFPSALLEAMTAGLACICFDCPSGPGEIVRDGVDGLLVPEGDTVALAAAMDRCMRSPELRGALGDHAAQVGARFEWQAMVDAYERVLLSQC